MFGEMFANFDIHFWATDGLISAVKSSKSRLPEMRRRVASQMRVVMLAATASALTLHLVSEGVGVQNGIILDPIVHRAVLQGATEFKAVAEPTGFLAFERQSKELLNSVAAGRAPSIPSETLSAIRAALQRQATKTGREGDPDAERLA